MEEHFIAQDEDYAAEGSEIEDFNMTDLSMEDFQEGLHYRVDIPEHIQKISPSLARLASYYRILEKSKNPKGKMKNSQRRLLAHSSAQDLKLFFARAKTLRVNSQFFLKNIKYFKRLKHITISVKKTSQIIPNLKSSFCTLKTLDHQQLGDGLNRISHFNIIKKSINLDFEEYHIKEAEKKIISGKLVFPHMNELVISYSPEKEKKANFNSFQKILLKSKTISLDYMGKNNLLAVPIDMNTPYYNVSRFFSPPKQRDSFNKEKIYLHIDRYLFDVMAHQPRLKKIVINSESIKLSISTLLTALIKYRPYLEIHDSIQNFSEIIYNLTPFSFCFIQTSKKLMIDMRVSKNKIPEELAKHVGSDQKSILYAQNYENGERTNYIHLNSSFFHFNPYLYEEFDYRFFILDDGSVLSEQKLHELVGMKSLAYPENVNHFSYNFKNDENLSLEIIKRVTWWIDHSYLNSNLNALSLKNLLIGEDPRCWSLLFDFIKQNSKTLRKISLEFNVIENTDSLKDLFIPISILFHEIQNVSIRFAGILQIDCQRFESDYSLKIELLTKFEQFNNFLSHLKVKFERFRDISLKFKYFDPSIFQDIQYFLDLITTGKLEITILDSRPITNQDIIRLTSLLQESRKVDQFFLILVEPFHNINSSITQMCEKLHSNNTSHCKLGNISLKKYFYSEKLENIERISF